MYGVNKTSGNLGDVDHRGNPALWIKFHFKERRLSRVTVYVLSKDGERLMPTTRLGRVRRLLRDGRAVIASRKPFTVQLTYETTSYTQDLEFCVDAGYEHIGVSLKSEKREYERKQYDLLADEKERRDDQRRYRRTRRNRLRYRKPRFDNRRAAKDWLAPSIRNKADRHVEIAASFVKAAPITDVYVEVGQFDTQVLAAVQEGKPLPRGMDYQHGEQYGVDTLREAVFQRDRYRCIFCGRDSFKNGAVLHAHHAYFWRGQHGDRLSELATCCEKCHTAANHQPGGKLWGYDKPLPRYTGVAFMNAVKWSIYTTLKELLPCPVHLTYGATTKRSRLELGLEKSHTNDAYAMGKYHPAKRAEEAVLQKRRRNNRILEKFYDAKVIDRRDGKKVSGKDLGCERTSRREPRSSEKSLRRYCGKKLSKGKRSIRRKRYAIRPGGILLFGGKRYTAIGVHNKGASVILKETQRSLAISKAQIFKHTGGWETTCA